MIRALSVLLLSAPLASAAPVPKEVKGPSKLDGLWEIAAMEVLGKPREWPAMRWKIEGEKITILHALPGAAPAVRGIIGIKIDPAAPKSIDYNTAGRGPPRPGLYEVDGDTLKVVLNVSGADRPATMKSDESTVFYTFKRVKE
jgi:uncharacterized protein (TIGR03067 family)